MKKFKQIPKFKNEDQERNFWANHDSTQYIDWSKADKVAFSKLIKQNFLFQDMKKLRYLCRR